MSATFDAVNSAGVSGFGATLTNNNLTIGTGQSNYIVVATIQSRGALTALGITWNGASLTAVPSASGAMANGAWTAMYYLLSPASGNHSLVASWTGNDQVSLSCVSFFNVGSIANGIFSTGTSAAPTVSVTTGAGDAVVASCVALQTLSAPNGSTIFIDNTDVPNHSGLSNYVTGASNPQVMSCTMSPSQNWGYAGVDLVAAGAATRTPTLTLMGVG